MKFLRLTLAEIKKIILKPTFYILVGCLFVAVIISSFFFAPKEREEFESQISGSSLTSLNNNFNSASESVIDSKLYLNNSFTKQVELVSNFNNLETHKELNSRVGIIFKSYFENLDSAISTANYNTKLLTDIYDASGDLLQYFDSIKNSTTPINFIIKSEQFDFYVNLLRNIRSSLPSTTDDINALENDYTALVTKVKFVYNTFKSDVNKMINECSQIKQITLNQNFLDYIQNDFSPNVTTFLDYQTDIINRYYLKNNSFDNNKTHILQFRYMLNDYKATVQIANITISNLINIEKLSHANGNINNYLGYEEISLYKLKENTSFNTYLINNKIKYSDASSTINFNINSQAKTNCYDFAYYLMAISNLILTIILVYFACMSFSGEKHDGLMRMNLTKPVSRTKLYFAKICSMLTISFIAYFTLALIFLLIGVCIYGSGGASIMVAVFSGSKAFAVAPFGNFIYKIFSLYLASAFYIILTSFISILFSNPVFSVVVSFLVYLFALITNSFLAKTAFIKILPFIHLDMSFFFGGGVWGKAFLTSLIYSGANFWLSLIYMIITFTAIILASCQIFKRQDH